MEAVCSLKAISKSFPGVKALEDVSLDIFPGQFHAIMGENGAGKSTLMKILSGMYKPDSGQIFFDGKAVHFNSISESLDHGIAMVYQELNPIPDMTVAENIFIGMEPRNKLGLVDKAKMNAMAKELLVGMKVGELNPDRNVRHLSVAEKQLIEIIKAERRNPKILIMDEPTSALTDREVDRLFDVLNEMKDKGVAILYISHRTEEIFRISDKVTIMRDGRHITTKPIAEIDTPAMIKLMVGREMTNVFPSLPDAGVSGDILLDVKNLTAKDGSFSDISFVARAGEILGIAGLMGAGRTELVETIFGLRKKSGGEVYIKGRKLEADRPEAAINDGMALVTEDRRGTGLIVSGNVTENITLASGRKITNRFGLINKRVENRLVDEKISQLAIKVSGKKQVVENLSGGNQQKVVLAKWLLTDADIVIFDEPTRGIDVGAKYEIYLLMIDMVKRGKAVVMISSEMPEIINMSHRVIALHEGSLIDELIKDDINQYILMERCAGIK